MSWHAESDFESHPYQDQAELLIDKDGEDLTQDEKANLWDDYHAAKNPTELVQRLQNHNVSNALKSALWNAKNLTAPSQSPADKVSDALRRIAKVDPATLAVAEKHPTVTKAILDAATKG
jgi:hypothetical protein